MFFLNLRDLIFTTITFHDKFHDNLHGKHMNEWMYGCMDFKLFEKMQIFQPDYPLYYIIIPLNDNYFSE